MTPPEVASFVFMCLFALGVGLAVWLELRPLDTQMQNLLAENDTASKLARIAVKGAKKAKGQDTFASEFTLELPGDGIPEKNIREAIDGVYGLSVKRVRWRIPFSEHDPPATTLICVSLGEPQEPKGPALDAAKLADFDARLERAAGSEYEA